jgi:hypothetical protein
VSLSPNFIREGHQDMIPEAKRFLALLEDMQALHASDKDRLRAQLTETKNT